MERCSQIEQLRISCGLDDEDLVLYYKASDYLSATGKDLKMRAIPAETRERITKFYRHLREAGLYAAEPKQERPKYHEIVSYEEGWYRILKANPNESPQITREDVKKILSDQNAEWKARFEPRLRTGNSVTAVVQGTIAASLPARV